MGKKFQNKYRNVSIRLQQWDYAWNAAYFITICTKNREYYFGEISAGKMQLSPVGILADVLWYEIKNHTRHVILGAFVVMPNHVHGILILDDGNDGTDSTLTEPVGPRHALGLPPPTPPSHQSPSLTPGKNRFQNQGRNTVSSIIGSYKSAVTRHAHRLGHEFELQSRFHDHIIRNDESFGRIENYIITNPLNWKDDKFNSRNC